MALGFVKGEKEQQNFAALLAAKGQLIPYVGAGFSFAQGKAACPSWGGFLDCLYNELKADMTADEISQYQTLRASEHALAHEQVLDLLFECGGIGRIRHIMRQTFDKPLPDDFKAKFNLFHQVFKGPWLTTNVERFIEDGYPDSPAKLTVILGNEETKLQQSLNQGALNGYLIKLHGDIKTASSWVLSHQHYQQHYGAKQGFKLDMPLPALLERLFTNQSLLFIGCSLAQDRPMKLLAQLAKNDGARVHFALVKRDEKSGDELKRFTRRLSNLNITPIWLDDYADINLVLQQLATNTAAIKTAITAPPVIAAAQSINAPNIFVGRETELAQLTTALQQPGSVYTVSGQLYNLIGIGGIGKTTLAREALSRCQGDFPEGCFDIRIDEMSVQEFAMTLVRKLALPWPEPQNDDHARQYITQILQQKKLLLLLDNVNKADDLLQLLPGSYQSSVIVTSRDQELHDALRINRGQLSVRHSQLQVFSDSEALDMFKVVLADKYQAEQQSVYLAIAQQLHFLPIALRLAISTMLFGQRYQPAQLLVLLKEHKQTDPLALIDGAAQYEANHDQRSLSAVFDLSTPLLTPALKHSLALLAVCSPEPVAEDFVALLNHKLSEKQLNDGLMLLQRYSWCQRVTIDGINHYQLHLLVRQVVRQQLVDDDLTAHFVATVQQHFITTPQHFKQLDRWINQTDEAVLQLKHWRDKRLAAWAGWDFGQYCANRGHGERFINYCQWLISVFADDKRHVAMALGNQALILQTKGQLDEAMVLHQQQQRIYEELGDKAGLSKSYGNQGLILQDKGQLDEAIALHQQEQQLCEELGDKAGLAKSYCNQALILQAKGQLDEAMALNQQQQQICEALGDKAGLSISYGNQAVILRRKGQLDEAMALHQKDHQICEALGDKAGLAICYWNQGDLLGEQGDSAKQKRLWQQSIELKKACGLPTAKLEAALAKLL